MLQSILFEPWPSHYYYLLAVWVFLQYLPFAYTIYTEKRVMYNHERDQKYLPWARKDRQNWSYLQAFMISLTWYPRVFFALFIVTCGTIISIILQYGHPTNDTMSKRTRLFQRYMYMVVGRSVTLAGGCIYTNATRTHFDYSKYLGPDYKYRYNKVGLNVCNHIHMYDTTHGVFLQGFGGYEGSFIGKATLMKVPLLGPNVRPIDALLFNRDEKDASERDTLVGQIKERQMLAEEGKKRQLTIFPEGCSTNGEYVIQFKKGAFDSLRAVKPFSAKAWSLFDIDPNGGGCLGWLQQTISTAMSGAWTYKVKELPVFEPNDYFWKHHWDGKEEKWRVYARTIQKIIAEANDLKISDNWAEDKNKYKALLRNKKKRE